MILAKDKSVKAIYNLMTNYLLGYRTFIKLFLLVVTVMSLFLLSACNKEEPSINTIFVSELTEREKAILETTANNPFVFEFDVSAKYKEISAWIEIYEFGKLVDKIGDVVTPVKKNGFIIFANEKQDNGIPTNFYISVSNENGFVSFNNSEPIIYEKNSKVTEDIKYMSASWSNFYEPTAYDGGEAIVANVFYTNRDRNYGMAVDYSPKYNEGDTNGLEQYDVAYLYKIEFLK